MSDQLAVVVIATARRRPLLPMILGSIPVEVDRVVVGDFPRAWAPEDCRYFEVPAITRTTIDALMRRDVGWLVTTAEAVCFLSDDHCLAPAFYRHFIEDFAEHDDWDLLRPARYTLRNSEKIWLNNGIDQYGSYIGGHGGVYRRCCALALPWMAGPHHLNWDLLHTRALVDRGLQLRDAGQKLAIVDIDPGARPWE